MIEMTEEDKKAQKLIESWMNAFDVYGIEATIKTLPAPMEVLGGIGFMVANVEMPEEFRRFLQSTAMHFVLQEKIKDSVAEAVRTKITEGSSEQQEESSNSLPPQPDNVKLDIQHDQAVLSQSVNFPWCEACQKAHPITTHGAHGMSVGRITEAQSNVNMLLFQLFQGDAHQSPGLHAVMTAGEVDMLVKNIGEIRKTMTQKAH